MCEQGQGCTWWRTAIMSLEKHIAAAMAQTHAAATTQGVRGAHATDMATAMAQGIRGAHAAAILDQGARHAINRGTTQCLRSVQGAAVHMGLNPLLQKALLKSAATVATHMNH